MAVLYENKSNDDVTLAIGHHLSASAHLHSHIEVVYMLEGKSRGWINDRSYDLLPGDIFIVFPNQVHRYETFDKERYLLVIFPKEYCHEYNYWFKNFVPRQSVLHVHDFETSLAASILMRLYENRLETGEIADTIQKGYLLAFLGYMIKNLDFVEEKTDEISLLKNLLNYCEANYNQDLSLTLLEQKLHANRFYISHLFSRKLKMKFNSYVNSLRVEHACKMLRNTDMSITEISQEVGFSTSRTFNRAFVQIIGTSPSAYRHKFLKKD